MIEIKQENISAAFSLVKEAIETKTALSVVCESRGFTKNMVASLVWCLKTSDTNNVDDNTKKSVEYLMNAYDEYLSLKGEFTKVSTTGKPVSYDSMTAEERLNNNYDAYSDENYDSRSIGEAVRNGDVITLSDGITKTNKITSYYYNIKIKGKQDLIGELTREEMEMIYRLYSNMDGANLTQRVVSRHFKNLTFPDFKRILRAFNVTKSSHPVAPHVIEENSLDETVDLIYRNKENNLFKKIEEERSKQTEKILKETQKELVDAKAKYNDWKSMVNQIILDDIIPFTIVKKEVNREMALVVYLSDMHVGADTKKDSVYSNLYDKEEFNNRLRKVCDEIVHQNAIYGRFDKIIVCNLGDSLDGYNNETTRGGHGLSQNMDNKTQFNVFINGMITFFDTLYNIDVANNIEYMCVGDSNHDGDFGYAANKTIEIYLTTKYPGMNVRVFDKFIEHFEYGKHTFILSHGKDKEDKHHGFPLNLNDATELYFDEFIYHNNINNDCVHVITGDLHQTSVNHGKRFRYKKVGSLYGSSKWIHTNFGNTKPVVDYEVVMKDSSRVMEGRLILI